MVSRLELSAAVSQIFSLQLAATCWGVNRRSVANLVSYVRVENAMEDSQLITFIQRRMDNFLPGVGG